MTSTPLGSRLAHFGLRIARLAALIYCVLLLLLLFFENWLLYPAPPYPDPSGDWNATYLPHEEVEFASADGTKLHGWLVERERPRAVLLYCHGNGDDLGHLGWYLKELRDRQRVTVFAFDYRGYGRSEGSPSEAGVLADGHAAQQWLAQRLKINPEEIVLMGRSLGGCVTVDMAVNNGARGLILQNTTTSIPDVAALIYWFAPVHWLMKNRYDSLSKIGRYHGPVLMSHGTADILVPISLGRKLFDAIPSSQKLFVTFDNVGHNDPEPRSYDAALDEFLESLPP